MSLRNSFRDAAVPESAGSIVSIVRDRQLSVAAAGVAYYAFNALLPTLVLAVVAISASGNVGTAVEQIASIANVSQENLRVVEQTIQEGAGVAKLAVVAGALAAWNALQLGRAIADVFEAVYGQITRSRLERARDLVVVFLTWLGALVVLLAAGVMLATVESTFLVRNLWPLGLFVGLVVVFLPMYLVFPAGVSLLEALPGTAFAAAVWTLSVLVFHAYAASATSVQLFGILGVVLLVLTWLYVGSLVLVAGVAANAVLAGSAVDTDG